MITLNVFCCILTVGVKTEYWNCVKQGMFLGWRVWGRAGDDSALVCRARWLLLSEKISGFFLGFFCQKDPTPHDCSCLPLMSNYTYILPAHVTSIVEMQRDSHRRGFDWCQTGELMRRHPCDFTVTRLSSPVAGRATAWPASPPLSSRLWLTKGEKGDEASPHLLSDDTLQ